MPNYQAKGFNDIIEVRLWIKNFVKWYNTEHHHSGIQFVTLAERHAGLDSTNDVKILIIILDIGG